MFANQGVAAVSEERFDAQVEVVEAAFDIEGVDEVEGVFDQKTVHLLRGLQTLLGDAVVAVVLAFEQRVADGPAQLVGVVRLEQEVVGAAAQGTDGRVHGFFAADHDDRLAALVAEQPIHHGEPGGVGQAVVEDEQIERTGVQTRERLGDGTAVFDQLFAALKQGGNRACQGRLIDDDKDSDERLGRCAPVCLGWEERTFPGDDHCDSRTWLFYFAPQ